MYLSSPAPCANMQSGSPHLPAWSREQNFVLKSRVTNAAPIVFSPSLPSATQDLSGTRRAAAPQHSRTNAPLVPRLVPPPHRWRTLPPAAELPLLCPRRSAPPPAASPMITKRSEEQFSLIRKRRMRLYTSPSMTKRGQKRQAKEKRKDRNCRRRPITSPVSFLCAALPSAAVGTCAHQYKLKTVLCRHHAENRHDRARCLTTTARHFSIAGASQDTASGAVWDNCTN